MCASMYRCAWIHLHIYMYSYVLCFCVYACVFCASMYLCMRMYVEVHVCIYVSRCAWIHLHIYACMYACMQTSGCRQIALMILQLVVAERTAWIPRDCVCPIRHADVAMLFRLLAERPGHRPVLPWHCRTTLSL